MRAVVVIAIVLGFARTAAAHPIEPTSLELDERAPGVVDATIHTPAPTAIAPAWPAACAAVRTSIDVADDVRVERFTLDCGGRSLAGLELGVDGLAAHDTIALVHVRLADGTVVREVLGPSRPRLVVPASARWTTALASYVWLGVEHLLGGLDHVLFILGLMFVVRGLRARVVTLTAFTLGHSVTLALATLDVVRLPAAPVEIAIALTLLVVAVQVVEPRRDHRAALLAGAFGLVHGLGFAGVLVDAGLPASDVPLALAGFNLGVELGQLAVVLVAAGLGTLLRGARVAPLARPIAGYAIGALAAMWVIERALTLAGS